MADPALNPALDRQAIAAAYAREGRVHIPDVLTEDSAARIRRCLESETDWSLLSGADTAQAWRVAALAAADESRIMQQAYGQARDKFHYLYDGHSLTKEGEAYGNPAHYLATVTAFLNGDAVLDFIRAVTGQTDIAFASIQATRYRPGHFLNQHDDHNDPRRRTAFVLNMTPNWRTDWGGALQFHDAAGTQAWYPAFNALNLFRVPQAHSVGYVAPFAGAHRLSLTGWFTAR